MATNAPTHEEKKTMPVSTNTNTGAASATEKSIVNVVENALANIPEDFKAYCYTCDTHVQGKNAIDHLYFGILDCTLCSFKILNCQKLQSIFKGTIIRCKNNEMGEHDYKWNSATPDYIAYFKLKELSIDRFCSNKSGPPLSTEVTDAVGQYMMSLSALFDHEPWKLAYENCLKNPKLAPILSEYKKNAHAKDNENEIRVQLGNCTKSLSSVKGCENSINPEPCDVNPKKRTNDGNCIPAKQPGSEVSECAVKNKSEKEKNIGGGNMLCTTTTCSLPEPEVLVLNENSSESLNCIKDSTEFSLRTDLTDSSKDGTRSSQAKQISKPSVSDCPPAVPERILFEDDFGDPADPDDPDEVMLQNCSFENLDEMVEYVTVDDDGQKDAAKVTEERESLSHAVLGEDGKDFDALGGKRKASDRTVDGVESELNLLKKFRMSNNKSSFVNFKPPDKILGDNYLVIHYPSQGCPEECPNCYCEFCPSMLTVNCSTYVSTIICADCKLTLYVLPD